MRRLYVKNARATKPTACSPSAFRKVKAAPLPRRPINVVGAAADRAGRAIISFYFQ